MKAAFALVTLALFLAVGALGLMLFSGNRDASGDRHAVSTASAEPVVLPASDGSTQSGEILARMDSFSREIEDLRAQMAALKTSAARETVAEIAPAKPVDEPTAAAFASEHRAAILKVIDEDRQEQKRKQEEEQRARDLQAALARAERTAKQFGLAADQQKALADVYILERQKMEDFRNQMRDQGGMGGDPEAMRASFREIRDWRVAELTNRLGTDLAQKINDADMQGFRGGFGPDGGGGGGRRGNRGQGGGGDNGQNGGNRPGGGF